MITYTTGNLLQSDAECLVNTVNCEGYMGKGIAYQFKLEFPENNKSYEEACRKGQVKIGSKLHYFEEKNKIIVNFPTKDKWRAKSQISYIEQGLKELEILILNLNIELNITSIAIPPLGSGNGGLNWYEVKSLINKYFHKLSEEIDVIVYEPSQSYDSKPAESPKLSLSSLILMKILENLNGNTKLRFQKSSYFFNIFLHKKYFKFDQYKYGPYSHSIEILYKKIKEFENYYSTSDTTEAYNILYKQLISKNIENQLSNLLPLVNKACNYVNRIESDKRLECISTILFLIEENKEINYEELMLKFNEWSDKSKKFSEQDVENSIYKLEEDDIILKSFTGYCIV